MTKRLFVVLALGALIALGLVLYRHHSTPWNVEPHAAEEIRKARQR